MRLCVYGAGAIGAYLAVGLAESGHDVCVIARGLHLQAIRAQGITLIEAGRERVARVAASDDPAAFGVQDYVISTLKAHQAYACATSFAPLLGADTPVVSAVNGIPWWYFYRHPGPLDGYHPACVDPGGRQWRALGPERAIGCVIDAACEVIAPGVVVHRQFRRFTLGDASGGRTPRVMRLSACLNEAGFDAPVRDDIRWNVWLKLWGNVGFNPISVLTGATLDRMTTEPALRALCRDLMLEAKAVNEALGIRIPVEMIERRLTAAGLARDHKMSMLQDFERGRSLEIDALVGVVQELGRLVNVATPRVDAMLALVRERGRQVGVYRPLAEARPD